MAYPIRLKEKIIKLRKKGYSLNEIYRKFKVSKSVISDWVKNVSLSNKAKNRLLTKINWGN